MIKTDFVPSPTQVTNYINNLVTSGATSLPEVTQATRLTPIVLIDKSLTLADDDALTNILQTMLSIYTAHYLQAVSLTNTIKGVSTLSILDQFATDRDLTAGRFANTAVGMMSLECDKLENYTAMEADKNNDIQGHVNLAIGRLLHVKLGTSGESVTMPVTVVLNPRVINSTDLPNIMTMVSDDESVVGRYHKWRAGEIESFIDYALALDLIERDRKALLNDSSGIYADARAKKQKGFFATLLTGKRSLNTASTMAVISKRTAEELELAMKGKLKRQTDREKYFQTTNSMMIVVVDSSAERINIYQRGISEFGTYTYTDIKDNGKKASAIDINSILKAYKLGESPSL